MKQNTQNQRSNVSIKSFNGALTARTCTPQCCQCPTLQRSRICCNPVGIQRYDAHYWSVIRGESAKTNPTTKVMLVTAPFLNCLALPDGSQSPCTKAMSPVDSNGPSIRPLTNYI